jgi:hypothetical protein
MATLYWEQPTRSELEPYFSPDLVKSLAGSKTDTGEITFAAYVNFKAQNLVKYSLETFPKTPDHFLQMIKPLLNQHFFTRMSQSLAGFDKLAGIPCTESFIQQRTTDGWMEELSLFAFRCINLGKKRRFQSSSNESTSSAADTFGSSISSPRSYGTSRTSYSVSPKTKTQGDRGLDLGLDGTAERDETKVKQVHLKGVSITDAWKKNSTMVTSDLNMKDLLNFGFPFPWTPAQHGKGLVFHGTARHLSQLPSDPRLQTWIDTWPTQMQLLGSWTQNKMAASRLGVVYTAFSPLRAFLWAAFTDHIFYKNVPPPATIAKMRTKWTSGGIEYAGVALFLFDVPTPTIEPLRYTVIPVGKEAEWAAAVYAGGAQLEWKGLKRFHGEDEKEWPDIMHGLEYEPQRSAIRGVDWSINLWRTTWKDGKANDELNQRYVSTLAITFELEEPKPAPALSNKREGPGGGKKDGDGGKKDDGLGTVKKGKGKDRRTGGGSSQT